MNQVESSYVFISHACADHDVVFRVVDDLEARGVRCWIDERDIPGGAKWFDEIRVRRHEAAAVMWIQSPASEASTEVLGELQLGLRRKQLIIPVQIDPVAAWGPLWDDFTLLQGYRIDKPGWSDRIAKQILALDGFASAAAPHVAAESRPPDSSSPQAERQERPAATATSAASVGGGHEALAVVGKDGRTFQLDGINGLGESLIESGDQLPTGDMGIITVSSDGSVIATSNLRGEVELWTLGAEDALPGPTLADALPADAGAPRLLSIDRPLGQAVRVIASGTSAVYSLMQRAVGGWSAMKLIDVDEPIASGAVVKDDVLFVRANGGTSWASSRSKRPLSLPTIRGIDSAVGADGRYYVAGWGSGPEGSSFVEVAVEVDGGWECIHRGPGKRAGIVRVVRDVVRQVPGVLRTSIAVESDEGSVTIIHLP